MLHIPTKMSNIFSIFFCIAIDSALKIRGVQGFAPGKVTHCLTLCILMDFSFRFDTINLG